MIERPSEEIGRTSKVNKQTYITNSTTGRVYNGRAARGTRYKSTLVEGECAGNTQNGMTRRTNEANKRKGTLVGDILQDVAG